MPSCFDGNSAHEATIIVYAVNSTERTIALRLSGKVVRQDCEECPRLAKETFLLKEEFFRLPFRATIGYDLRACK